MMTIEMVQPSSELAPKVRTKCPKGQEMKRQWLGEISSQNLCPSQTYNWSSDFISRLRFCRPTTGIGKCTYSDDPYKDLPKHWALQKRITSGSFTERLRKITAYKVEPISPAETRKTCLQCTKPELYSPHHQLDNRLPYLLKFNVVTSFVVVFWRTIWSKRRHFMLTSSGKFLPVG